jgi:hypothetical protein
MAWGGDGDVGVDRLDIVEGNGLEEAEQRIPASLPGGV